VRALTVFLVNKRRPTHRYYADVGYAFQARLALVCPEGFKARRDLSAYQSADPDLRLADLHYRDVCEWAVGRNAAAGWDAAEDATGRVSRVWTDPLPSAEVERVAPNEAMPGVVLVMDDLAEAAAAGAEAVTAALARLPRLYKTWMAGQREAVASLGTAPRREETARRLVAEMETARGRIAAGIAILADNEQARTAFRLMNLAVGAAARRRGLAKPKWRPFQLAFILLNLTGLVDKTHADREIADLLFFPTGGGKTEAYLGLAASVIALRRLKAHGVLGGGVAVIMRYTLRLLTLDQLGRAAGVVCALELLRLDPANRDVQGQAILGDWPIEIGLWVGAGASPNVLGGKGKTDDYTAVGQVRRYRDKRTTRSPAPLKVCPWCSTAFTADSFQCVPNEQAPTNLAIRCVNPDCDFGRGQSALPIVTVDEAIYRRLPAFLIATVDKFAALPWVGETGAFFGHVDRFDPAIGFFGFYRAVEATSVTPWATRALDRALAAILVAAGRHLDSDLTPESGVNRLKDNPELREKIRGTVLTRARAVQGLAGEAALGALIDATFADWMETAQDQSAAGAPFSYAARASPRHLLLTPLARELPKLTPQHRRFVAGRSMRDVEPNVAVKVADPWGRPDAAMEAE
jgi:hypothetical protein